MTETSYSPPAEYWAAQRREAAIEIRRQYRQIPPAAFITEHLSKLDQEVRQLQIRRRNLNTERAELTSDAAIDAALDADREAVVAAIRAGKPATSAGAKAETARKARLAAIETEYDAGPALIKALESEMRGELVRINADDAASGRTAAAVAAEAVEKALGDLESARAQYHGAQALVRFVQDAADGVDGVQWRGPVAPPLDLSDHGARLGIRMYSSDPTPTLELSDVAALIRAEMGN